MGMQKWEVDKERELLSDTGLLTTGGQGVQKTIKGYATEFTNFNPK